MNSNPISLYESIEKKFSELALRLSSRPDSEHEQAAVRIIIQVVLLIYVLASGPASKTALQSWYFILIFISFFIILSLTLFCSILTWPDKSPLRRVIGIIADVSAFSFGLAITGEIGAPWYAVYLWITFGNGFRYGEKYLYLSGVLSVLGFSCVILFTPYWQENLPLGIGLLASLIVLPGYAAKLTKRIHQERRRAEAANHAKSEFLARMSHEIRTPLNGIIGTGELLKTCDLNQIEREYVDTIYTSGHTLLRLIEDILDISKIEAGKLELERAPFDLYAMINSTMKMLSPQVNARKVRLYTHIDPEIPFRLIGDPLHLRQILINLIGNAIKFTEVGHIQLRCLKLNESNGRIMVRFEVIDTGIGIPQEIQEKIFEKFTQADGSTTRRFGGTGLGTTIAKQLVELMGGQIGLISSLSDGSLFWFELTFEPQEKIVSDTEMQLIQACKVLRVSDLSEVETSAVHCLHGWGVQIEETKSANEVLHLLKNAVRQSKPFNVLLLDNLPYHQEVPVFIKTLLNDLSYHGTSVVLINNKTTLPIDIIPKEIKNRIHILNEPVDKVLLFNLLHASQVSNYEDFNTITVQDTIPAKIHSQHSLEILVAEDNAINRLVIARMLEQVGHRYQQVEDGQELLDALETRHYDLVIVDMQMPQLGGLEAFKMFRFAHPDNTMPFIILTANATIESRKQCEDAGIQWFLTKPVSSQKLYQVIQLAVDDRPKARPEQSPTGETLSAKDEAILNRETIDELISLAPNQAFLMRLLGKLKLDGAQLISDMSVAVEANNAVQFSSYAHALKGSAANLGLNQLQAQALSAERLPQSQLLDHGMEQVASIRVAFNQGVSELTKLFDNPQFP